MCFIDGREGMVTASGNRVRLSGQLAEGSLMKTHNSMDLSVTAISLTARSGNDKAHIPALLEN